MKVLNFGSLNIDYVYSVDHNVQSKETLASYSRNIFCGGKGLNQSIALKKAGLDVYHAGCIGKEGTILLDELQKYDVNTHFVKTIDEATGHAIIQVDKEGQNSILLYGGANQCIDRHYIDEVLLHFEKGDVLLLQNEVSNLDYMIEKASDKGMMIVLNPSPFDEKIKTCHLDKVNLFFINEIEGYQLTLEHDPMKILDQMKLDYPNSQIVLTLGDQGSYYQGEKRYFQDIFQTNVVDTTAAGDTFSGYFMYGYLNHLGIEKSLRLAAKASSITVSKQGASVSIPHLEELGE